MSKVPAAKPTVLGEKDAVFRVRASIKNNRLIEARNALGYTSARAAAHALGVNYVSLVRYESFLCEPVSARSNEWKKSALAIARAYAKEPAWLWPEETFYVGTPVLELRMDFPRVLFEPPKTPEQLCAEGEEKAELLRCVTELTPRHQRVLLQAYGLGGQAPWTLKAIAAYQGVSVSRARQLTMQALRQLRRKLEKGKDRR